MRSLAVLIACAGPARAEHATDLVTRPLALRAGELEVQLTAEASLRPRALGKPVSLAPDVWFGVTQRLTLGLVHSNRSVDQIDTGDSFCLNAGALDCDRTYQGSGLDARYAVRDDLAPRARLLLRDVDPAKPAVAVGVLARWQRGRYAITTDPYVRVGLANRARGNRDALVAPVWLAAQPSCRWVVALHTGIDGELASWRDGWHVPIGLVVGVNPIARLDVIVEAGFPSLLGPQTQTTDRVVAVTLGWRQALARPASRSSRP